MFDTANTKKVEKLCREVIEGHKALSRATVNEITELVKEDANPSGIYDFQTGDTFLHAALRAEQPVLAKCLILNGADANCENRQRQHPMDIILKPLTQSGKTVPGWVVPMVLRLYRAGTMHCKTTANKLYTDTIAGKAIKSIMTTMDEQLTSLYSIKDTNVRQKNLETLVQSLLNTYREYGAKLLDGNPVKAEIAQEAQKHVLEMLVAYFIRYRHYDLAQRVARLAEKPTLEVKLTQKVLDCIPTIPDDSSQYLAAGTGLTYTHAVALHKTAKRDYIFALALQAQEDLLPYPQAVQDWVKDKTNINHPDPHLGNYPLHIAAMRGNLPMVVLLVKTYARNKANAVVEEANKKLVALQNAKPEERASRQREYDNVAEEAKAIEQILHQSDEILVDGLPKVPVVGLKNKKGQLAEDFAAYFEHVIIRTFLQKVAGKAEKMTIINWFKLNLAIGDYKSASAMLARVAKKDSETRTKVLEGLLEFAQGSLHKAKAIKIPASDNGEALQEKNALIKKWKGRERSYRQALKLKSKADLFAQHLPVNVAEFLSAIDMTAHFSAGDHQQSNEFQFVSTHNYKEHSLLLEYFLADLKRKLDAEEESSATDYVPYAILIDTLLAEMRKVLKIRDTWLQKTSELQSNSILLRRFLSDDAFTKSIQPVNTRKDYNDETNVESQVAIKQQHDNNKAEEQEVIKEEMRTYGRQLSAISEQLHKQQATATPSKVPPICNISLDVDLVPTNEQKALDDAQVMVSIAFTVEKMAAQYTGQGSRTTYQYGFKDGNLVLCQSKIKKQIMPLYYQDTQAAENAEMEKVATATVLPHMQAEILKLLQGLISKSNQATPSRRKSMAAATPNSQRSARRTPSSGTPSTGKSSGRRQQLKCGSAKLSADSPLSNVEYSPGPVDMTPMRGRRRRKPTEQSGSGNASSNRRNSRTARALALPSPPESPEREVRASGSVNAGRPPSP